MFYPNRAILQTMIARSCNNGYQSSRHIMQKSPHRYLTRYRGAAQNSQLHSFTASQLHSFTASQLHSFTAEGFLCPSKFTSEHTQKNFSDSCTTNIPKGIIPSACFLFYTVVNRVYGKARRCGVVCLKTTQSLHCGLCTYIRVRLKTEPRVPFSTRVCLRQTRLRTALPTSMSGQEKKL